MRWAGGWRRWSKAAAEPALLAAMARERQAAADENILHSARTTRFMTPADGVERQFRDAVLSLAGKAAFARGLVNAGRLSMPCVYPTERAG